MGSPPISPKLSIHVNECKNMEDSFSSKEENYIFHGIEMMSKCYIKYV